MALNDGKWVRLVGESLDIAAVTAYDDPPAVTFGFREDEGTWWMKAALFEPIEDAAEIWTVADDLLRVINGCAQGVVGNHRSVKADQAVYFIDSTAAKREQRVIGSRVESRLRAGLGRTPRVWLRAAVMNSDVAEALRIVGKDETTWSDLYHLLELLEQINGQPVNEAGWISGSERTRFTQTANSRGAVGEQARHGKSFDPPRRPMSLKEARDMMRVLTERVLDSLPEPQA